MACIVCLFADPAQAEFIPVEPKVVTPSGVNLFSGQYTYSSDDLFISDLVLQRFYTGGNITRSNYFGNNWSHNYDIYAWERLVSTSTKYFHVVIGGKTVSYQRFSSTSFSPGYESESGNSIRFESGEYKFTDRSQVVYIFSAVPGNPRGSSSWPVKSILYPNGKKIDFVYNASGKLKNVISNTGNALVFDYNSSGHVSSSCVRNMSIVYVGVTSTCVGVSGAVIYGYTGTGVSSRLTSVVNSMGKTTTISYDPTYTRYVRCVTEPDSPVCPYTNIYSYSAIVADYPMLVVSQQLKYGGGVISFNYYHHTPIPDPAPYPWEQLQGLDGWGNWTDESGFTWGATFRRGQQPVSIFDPRLPAREDYEYYWTPTDVSKVTYREGNFVEYKFGLAGRVTEERRGDKTGNAANDIVRTASYTSDCWGSGVGWRYCTKPLTVTDSNGVTHYAYDPAHGGVLTKMLPAPTAGAARPLERATWTQRYAWVRNASGTLTQAVSPLWLKASETQCQTLAGATPAAACDTSAQQIVTTYEYGANGTGESLLLKGIAVTSGGQTLRTCYAYDALGRRISETTPNSGLTSCP